MAKKTTSVGLKVAQFGDVNPAGGMPAVMKQQTKTLKGTASFTTEEEIINKQKHLLK